MEIGQGVHGLTLAKQFKIDLIVWKYNIKKNIMKLPGRLK